MNTQQAYINGFVKRAEEHGFSHNEAVELLKSAAPFASSGGYELLPKDYDHELNRVDLEQAKAPGILNHLKRNAGKYIGAGTGLSLAAIVNSQHDGYVPGTSMAAALPFLLGNRFDNAREENFPKKQLHDPDTQSKLMEYINAQQQQ